MGELMCKEPIGNPEWIQQTVRSGKSALRDWCEQQGFEYITEECIDVALNHEDPKIRREAKFAKCVRLARKKLWEIIPNGIGTYDLYLRGEWEFRASIFELEALVLEIQKLEDYDLRQEVL